MVINSKSITGLERRKWCATRNDVENSPTGCPEMQMGTSAHEFTTETLSFAKLETLMTGVKHHRTRSIEWCLQAQRVPIQCVASGQTSCSSTIPGFPLLSLSTTPLVVNASASVILMVLVAESYPSVLGRFVAGMVQSLAVWPYFTTSQTLNWWRHRRCR